MQKPARVFGALTTRVLLVTALGLVVASMAVIGPDAVLRLGRRVFTAVIGDPEPFPEASVAVDLGGVRVFRPSQEQRAAFEI